MNYMLDIDIWCLSSFVVSVTGGTGWSAQREPQALQSVMCTCARSARPWGEESTATRSFQPCRVKFPTLGDNVNARTASKEPALGGAAQRPLQLTVPSRHFI